MFPLFVPCSPPHTCVLTSTHTRRTRTHRKCSLYTDCVSLSECALYLCYLCPARPHTPACPRARESIRMPRRPPPPPQDGAAALPSSSNTHSLPFRRFVFFWSSCPAMKAAAVGGDERRESLVPESTVPLCACCCCCCCCCCVCVCVCVCACVCVCVRVKALVCVCVCVTW